MDNAFVASDSTFTSYYFRFVKAFFFDSVAWVRDNVFLGLLLLILPPVLAAYYYHVAPDWLLPRLTFYVYLAILSLYLLVRLIRTPWKLDAARQQEIESCNAEGEQRVQELNTTIEDKAAAIQTLEMETQKLRWPDNHPVIRFVEWDQNERGFVLANDGGPSLEVQVEEFKVGSNVWSSASIPGIPPDTHRGVLVWGTLAGPFERFQLLHAMKSAAGPAALYAPDYSVNVSLRVRDSRNLWYRSKATLTLIRSQGVLKFGPTTMEKIDGLL
jgi:hypothetical protein